MDKMTKTPNQIEPTNPAPLVQVERLVSHFFTDAELQDMALSCVPHAIQVRNVLNSVGFKFEDDGKPSLVTNHEPKPLGTMECWRDEEKHIVHYRQLIPAG